MFPMWWPFTRLPKAGTPKPQTPAEKADVAEAWEKTLEKGRYLYGDTFSTLDNDIKEAAVNRALERFIETLNRYMDS
jgi:hypothetical protein